MAKALGHHALLAVPIHLLIYCPIPTRRSHLCGQVWRDASLVDSAEAGVYFPCRQWFDKERGMSKELFPMIRRTEEKVEFRIRVREWGTG